MRRIRTENQLRAEVARLETKVAKLTPAAHAPDELGNYFTHGTGGMSAAQARGRQKRHAAQLAKIKDLAAADSDLKYLRARLAAFEAGECHPNGQPRADSPSRQRAASAVDMIGQFVRAHVKAGDNVEFLPNPQSGPSIVRRVNRKSVTLEPYGTQWSMAEIRPYKPDGSAYTPGEYANAVAQWCRDNGITG